MLATVLVSAVERSTWKDPTGHGLKSRPGEFVNFQRSPPPSIRMDHPYMEKIK